MEDTFKTIATNGISLAPEPLITVLGVKYLHLRTNDGSELYITEYGLPFTRCLMPQNHWDDDEWMDMHGVRLPGTSAVHRVVTKQVEGRSKEIVIKWNRMGQDIPGETQAMGDEAEFNSPFMEFSLVIELRSTRCESPGPLRTHKPLAIYVPRRHVKAGQLGRRRHKMEAIERSHEEISIDWSRNYAVIYEWLKGIDASEALQGGLVDSETMTRLVRRANQDLDHKGFAVSDNKPQHVIVRPAPGGGLVQDGSGIPLYGLVDFELLKRTPAREAHLKAQKRRDYLVRQARRFEPHEQYPPGLTPVNVLGVDYVYGQVESTGGALWVVGHDPVLFEYFLPEKWRRTPRTRLSSAYEIYETLTQDNVRLVWRVSRVGQIPDADPFVPREKRILDYGYNSPFQEFSIALDLSRKGVETTYPRAIYMTGHRSNVSRSLFDASRYEQHADLTTPEGHLLLSRQHQYLTIWGYWNGPDDMLAVEDQVVYTGIDALAAYREGRLSQRDYVQVMGIARKGLAAAGFKDLSLRGNHLLLSINRDQQLATDADGFPLVRICNFELLKDKSSKRQARRGKPRVPP